MLTFQRLAAAGAELVAPRLLVEEVGNALLTGIRQRRWPGAEADAAFAALRALPVRLVDHGADIDRAWDLARRYDAHPIHDMLYIALALRLRTTLVTADRTLRARLGAPEWIELPDNIGECDR